MKCKLCSANLTDEEIANEAQDCCSVCVPDEETHWCVACAEDTLDDPNAPAPCCEECGTYREGEDECD